MSRISERNAQIKFTNSTPVGLGEFSKVVQVPPSAYRVCITISNSATSLVFRWDYVNINHKYLSLLFLYQSNRRTKRYTTNTKVAARIQKVNYNGQCTPCGPILLYLRSHTKHLNGFSPEWIRRWAVRLASWENDFKQMWHWYGFSPEWVRMCVRKVEGRAYTLSQSRHLFALVPDSFKLSFWDWTISSCMMGPE